jgi:hypothetical protein
MVAARRRKEKEVPDSNSVGSSTGGLSKPTELWSTATLGTLGGGAVAAWIISAVIAGVFKIEAQKPLIGLLVSIALSVYLAYRAKKDKGIAVINGFLIYATFSGVAAHIPFVNQGTAGLAEQATLSAAFTTSWVQDPNMVAVQKDLIEMNADSDSALKSVRAALDDVRSASRDLPRPGRRVAIDQAVAGGLRSIDKAAERSEPRRAALIRRGIRPR